MAKRSSAFVPGSVILDASTMFSTDINSDTFKHFIVDLTNAVNTISTIVNIKVSGYYPTNEFITGELYFPSGKSDSSTSLRPKWREVVNNVVIFGGLPDTATKGVAHGMTITSSFKLIDIYGAANDYTTPKFRSLSGLEVGMDATYVYIKTTSNLSNYTDVDVIIKFTTT